MSSSGRCTETFKHPVDFLKTVRAKDLQINCGKCSFSSPLLAAESCNQLVRGRVRVFFDSTQMVKSEILSGEGFTILTADRFLDDVTDAYKAIGGLNQNSAAKTSEVQVTLKLNNAEDEPAVALEVEIEPTPKPLAISPLVFNTSVLGVEGFVKYDTVVGVVNEIGKSGKGSFTLNSVSNISGTSSESVDVIVNATLVTGVIFNFIAVTNVKKH